MKRHTVLIICIGIFMAVILVFVGWGISRSGTFASNSGSFYRIQTDSMYPEFEADDWIWCEDVSDPADLKVGDIITYWTVINGERVLNTHRIVAIHDTGDTLIFETKGDNNTAADPLTVHEKEIVGIYRFKLPF